MIKPLCVAVLAFLVLAACSTQVKVKPVEPQATVILGGGGGDFCPPGQAKQGRC